MHRLRDEAHPVSASGPGPELPLALTAAEADALAGAAKEELVRGRCRLPMTLLIVAVGTWRRWHRNTRVLVTPACFVCDRQG